MSLDINWQALDPALGETIKNLLNSRLTESLLPGFLRNVNILSFTLGSIPPEITIKDIADPFPEFYEDDNDTQESAAETTSEEREEPHFRRTPRRRSSGAVLSSSPEDLRRSLSNDHVTDAADDIHITDDDRDNVSVTSGPPPYVEHQHHSHRPMNSLSGWEGMNVPYFQSAFATPNHGIVSASGLSTPRPRFLGWSNTFNPMDTAVSTSASNNFPRTETEASSRRRSVSETQTGPKPQMSPDDVQLEVQVKYFGNIVVKLQVDLALNYPSPFFVTLPIEMTISELVIDTIAVAAYIDNKLHISLLEGLDNPIKDFKIKSQIGEQDKIALVDVEKVEKFMLREIQTVVEQELVFPSYYTFLL